jgi:putative phosphoribosyl transferase
MHTALYADRADAGRTLARFLGQYAGREDAVVLALPRGGVPVAAEVARALAVPLDIMPVRKLGVPGNEELAMGAIAGKDTMVLVSEVVGHLGIPDAEIARAAEREWAELRRREGAYRGARGALSLDGLTVILADDGLATGATMRAAIVASRAEGAREVVVAVPVAPADVCHELRTLADRVVCAAAPAPFGAVGRWYDDFAATSDDEVRGLLDDAVSASRTAPGSTPDTPRS